MPPDSTDLPFFVYGTLLRGHPNHHLIRGGTLSVEPAVLSGASMYDAGSYPYVVLGGSEEVRGELVHIRPEAYGEVLAVLDRLEDFRGPGDPGNDYDRVALTVTTGAGRRVRAWVYVAGPASRQAVAAMPAVPGGDWAAYTARRRHSGRG